MIRGTMILEKLFCLALFGTLAAQSVSSQTSPSKEIDGVYADTHALYLDLHEHPELSKHETQTAVKLAARLRSAGYDVTEHIGGAGFVAILKNGTGPIVMLRTELDALPVEEKTGLPYASKVVTKDDSGRDVHVMHACGHDLHMAAFLGAAEIMVHSKNTWHGTLMLIGQPAEEGVSGARAMLEDGLLQRFPKPDVGIALHVANALPAGQVGITPGIYNTNSDAMRVTIYGKGGHGSAPHTTVDPIVIAARTILTLQTINAREVKPGEVAVLTVGYIHSGERPNIIPDQAEFGFTVRTYKDDVRKQVLAAITRIVKAEAQAGGVAKEPLIERVSGTDAVYNDPKLAERLRAPLEAALGKENVIATEAITPSEDYAYFVEAGIPSLYFSLGGADPEKWKQERAGGPALPSNHSPLFAPVVEPSLKTGITAEVAVLRNLLNASAEDLHKLTATPQP